MTEPDPKTDKLSKFSHPNQKGGRPKGGMPKIPFELQGELNAMMATGAGVIAMQAFLKERGVEVCKETITTLLKKQQGVREKALGNVVRGSLQQGAIHDVHILNGLRDLHLRLLDEAVAANNHHEIRQESHMLKAMIELRFRYSGLIQQSQVQESFEDDDAVAKLEKLLSERTQLPLDALRVFPANLDDPGNPKAV